MFSFCTHLYLLVKTLNVLFCHWFHHFLVLCWFIFCGKATFFGLQFLVWSSSCFVLIIRFVLLHCKRQYLLPLLKMLVNKRMFKIILRRKVNKLIRIRLRRKKKVLIVDMMGLQSINSIGLKIMLARILILWHILKKWMQIMSLD